MGGSSKQKIGDRFFAKLAVFIGNPIEKLIGINFDNRGWLYKSDDNERTLRIESPNLYGENEGGVAGSIDIQPGTADQLPNAFYKEDFPKVSGYPFQSYLLFRGLQFTPPPVTVGGVKVSAPAHYNDSFYLGNSGYMKEMLLWPQRIHVRNDGSPQWYDEKAEIKGLSGIFIEYPDLSSLSWEMERLPSGTIPNINKRYTFNPIEINYELYLVTVEFTAMVETRPIVSGDSTESQWVFKNGEYDSNGQLKFWNRYELVISDPPQTFILNAGPASDKISSYGGSFSFVVKKGATFTASASTGDSGYQGAMNGYYQSIFFTKTKIEAYYSASDLNPIHKIREILTDDTAMHKPECDVNDENFKKAADVLYEEKIGISWSVTEKSCLDAINELCGHIEAGIRINRQTGLYEIVLFRDDWFSESDIHTLSQNKIKSLQLDVQNADESINQLNVSYYNRDAIKNSSFSIAENASIKNLQGRVNAETADFPYFMNQRNAAVVAQWKLKQMSTPVWQGTFTTGFYEARKWNRYDLLKLAWPRKWIGTILVRIMKINLGTGTDVSIDFVEVVSYSSDLSSNIVIDTPVDTTPKPPQPALFKTFELSYLEAVQLNGQKAVDEALAYNPDAGYAAVIAKRPQNNSLNALMYTDLGSGFERAGSIQYCEIAELDQSVGFTDTAFIVKNVGSLMSVSIGTQITIDSETMVYQSYDAETSLLTVKRGALDTIPQNHSADSMLYFADDFITVDPTEYVTGEIVDVKVLTTTPSGILSISDVDAQQVEIQARAIRPYPPAKVRINNAYYPQTSIITNDLKITWVDRNRLQQTGGEILGYFDDGVTRETGVTYSLELISQEEVLHTTNNINANTYTLAASILRQNKPHTLKIWSIRDGYESYQVFEHSFFIESASLILTATATKSNIVGSTVPTANVSVVVDETLKANMQADGSSIRGKAQAGATITIEVDN